VERRLGPAQIAGFLAIVVVPLFGMITLFSAIGYQDGNNSMLFPIFEGLAGIGVHGLAAVGAIIAIINNGPKGTAWTGLILNSFAVLLVAVITLMSLTA
jgi:hypothetical protein